jgi:hypothetical protein
VYRFLTVEDLAMQSEKRPKTPFIFEGATYQLCGSFESLVESENYFAQKIYGFNLGDALARWGENRESLLSGARKLLPAALRTFHPEISYEETQAMCDRAEAREDIAILNALWNMFPAKTPETETAHQHLRCSLESLAEANEFFQGKPGLLLLTCLDDSFTLDHVWRLFPCALHPFRPELSVDEARQLMTVDTVRIVLAQLDWANETAPKEAWDKFSRSVTAFATEEVAQEFIFRMAAKKQWPSEKNVN